jgi:hypothetical protein
MSTARTTAYVTAFVATFAGWTNAPAEPDFVQLQVSSPSGSPSVRVLVTTRGLEILNARNPQDRSPGVTNASGATPLAVTLGGVGEADIEVLDSRSAVVIDVVQLRQEAAPAQRLVGQAFHVARATLDEPFRVTRIERTAAAEEN